jgi:hypothetical protein
MYSELLSVLYAGVEPSDFQPTQEELILILLQCRSRLHRHSDDGTHYLADELAFQLDHDRTLLQLCSAMGIEHDPARFVQASAERRRLEEALRGRGISFPLIGEGDETELGSP